MWFYNVVLAMLNMVGVWDEDMDSGHAVGLKLNLTPGMKIYF